MTYPYCVTSCPANLYGPNCQYECGCNQGSCFDGPRGNGSCSCNKDWYGSNCTLTNPPQFLQAKFAADGLTFVITFDIDTSYGGQPSNTSFPCANVLANITLGYLDPQAACSWLSRKNISVSLAGTGVIRAGNMVVLKNNTIFAYPGSISAAFGALSLLPPDNAGVPALVLGGPKLVGSCDPITITANLQGSFSKPTLNVWSVTASTSNISDVVAFLSSYTQLIASIPDSVLVPGTVYTFSLNVTNIFGAFTTSNITINKSKFNVPTISIAGPVSVTTYAPQPLTLQGSVVIATSTGCQLEGALVWAWTVVRIDTQDTVKLAANVINKKNLVIPAGTLTPGANYTVTVFGSYPSLPGNLTNSASMTISVPRSDLVVAITGGNLRSSSITQQLVTNATSSYDPDGNSTLSYVWTCKTSTGDACLDDTGKVLDLPKTAALVYPPYALTADVTFVFTLTMLSSDGRRATSSVSIAMVSGIPPSVSINKPASPVISSSSQLALNGVVTPMTDTTFYWNETTGQIDLNNRANLLTSRTNINLVIKQNVLKPGATYSFVLLATNSNGTGLAGVDITVSPLPHGGICGVSPTSGFVVATPFTISCSGWEDISTLTYTFSYLLGNTEVTLRSQVAESLTTSLPLPSDRSGIVPIIVKITNRYNATTTTTFSATVTLAGNGSSAANTAFVQQAFDKVTADLSQYGDPDASIQSLLALSSVLQAPGDRNTIKLDAQAVVLSQKIFTLFAGVASNLTDASGSVEQQAGNVAVLSQSSSDWDDSSKTLLVNVLHGYAGSSGSASAQALGNLLTGLSNIFTTGILPNSAPDNTTQTKRTRIYVRGNFKRDTPQQNSSLGNNAVLYTKLRDSVSQISDNVLGSMVCGQDNTELSASNIKLTAGKVPRESIENASFVVDGMSTTFPFNSSFFGESDCMDMKIALQPIDLYRDSSSDFQSHIASVSVGTGGSEIAVKNLSEPIVLVFPIYNYTSSCNATSNCSQVCQYLNETTNKWQSDGCTVFSSNITHVVCHCDHLTSFSVQFKASVAPLEEAGKLITHPSFASLKDRPAPIIFIAAVFAVYLGAMAAAIRYDRKRGFYDTNIALADDIPLPMYSHHYEPAPLNSPPVSPPTSPPISPPTSPLSHEMSIPSIFVTPDGEDDEKDDEEEHLESPRSPTAGALTARISSDEHLGESTEGLTRATSNDPMLGAYSSSGSLRSHSSLGSVSRKMGRRSMRGSIRRKSLVIKEEEEKREKEAHLEKVAHGEHAQALSEKDFSASLDAVDQVYGVSHTDTKLTKWQEFRMDVSLRVKTNHRYFRIFFRKTGDPFSRARRVTVLLNVVITCLACNAIFYNAKHTEESIPISQKILIAFWSSLLITPVNLAVYFMLSKAGFRYPAMGQDVELDQFGNPIRNNSLTAEPFKPSRLLRREQQELNRLQDKYVALCEKAFNMSVETAVKIGPTGRERLMELVSQSRAQLEWLANRVQNRHNEEYHVYLNPPPPGKFTKLKNKIMGEWPWWWAIVGYVFSLLVSIFSVYICLIYAATFTKAAMNGWLISSGIAVAQDIILNQPLASVGGAIFGVFLGSMVNKLISILGGIIKDAS